MSSIAHSPVRKLPRQYVISPGPVQLKWQETYYIISIIVTKSEQEIKCRQNKDEFGHSNFLKRTLRVSTDVNLKNYIVETLSVLKETVGKNTHRKLFLSPTRIRVTYYRHKVLRGSESPILDPWRLRGLHRIKVVVYTIPFFSSWWAKGWHQNLFMKQCKIDTFWLATTRELCYHCDNIFDKESLYLNE